WIAGAHVPARGIDQRREPVRGPCPRRSWLLNGAFPVTAALPWDGRGPGGAERRAGEGVSWAGRHGACCPAWAPGRVSPSPASRGRSPVTARTRATASVLREGPSGRRL